MTAVLKSTTPEDEGVGIFFKIMENKVYVGTESLKLKLSLRLST